MPTTGGDYAFTLPTDGGSADVWGGLVNAAFEDVDTGMTAIAAADALKLPLSGGTMTGRVDTLTSTAHVVAIGSVSGTQAIDCTAGQGFTATLVGATTFTFNSPPAQLFGFVLNLTTGSSGVTWPASVKWAAGSAPALSGGTDILGFITFNSGTTWYGVAINLAAA